MPQCRVNDPRFVMRMRNIELRHFRLLDRCNRSTAQPGNKHGREGVSSIP